MRRKFFGDRHGNRVSKTGLRFSERRVVLTALLLVLSGMLSISGCVGLTATPSTSSSRDQSTSAAAISLSPATINFGSVAIGSTVSQSVTISNTGGSTLEVTQATISVNGFTLTGISFPSVIGAGKQSTFNVVYSPKAMGAAPGIVSIVSNAAASPSNVSISGTGVAATSLLNSSASSLNFGNVSVGTSSVLGVSITNAGNSNVTISNVNLSSTRFTASGVSAGLILAPGQSAPLNVTFSPSAAGNLSGSITVLSNATNSPAIISLLGSGTLTVPHSAELTWSASTSVVAGYNIYRSAVSGSSYSRLNSSLVAPTSYTDSTVEGGQTYYYTVTSVSSDGLESSHSAQVSAVVPSP